MPAFGAAVIAPDRRSGALHRLRRAPEPARRQRAGADRRQGGADQAGICIGHGACKTACPTGAITLVFGTATRRRDPERVADFESNVRGIFIAGELGGMGLIANAIEQGGGDGSDCPSDGIGHATGWMW
jgi:ferredoxin